jgi:hypothetical protein
MSESLTDKGVSSWHITSHSSAGSCKAGHVAPAHSLILVPYYGWRLQPDVQVSLLLLLLLSLTIRHKSLHALTLALLLLLP